MCTNSSLTSRTILIPPHLIDLCANSECFDDCSRAVHSFRLIYITWSRGRGSKSQNPAWWSHERDSYTSYHNDGFSNCSDFNPFCWDPHPIPSNLAWNRLCIWEWFTWINFLTPLPTLGPRNHGHTMQVWDHHRFGQYGSHTLVCCSKNKGARADHLDILMFHTFSWAASTQSRRSCGQKPFPLLQWQSSTIFRARKLTGKFGILHHYLGNMFPNSQAKGLMGQKMPVLSFSHARAPDFLLKYSWQ